MEGAASEPPADQALAIGRKRFKTLSVFGKRRTLLGIGASVGTSGVTCFTLQFASVYGGLCVRVESGVTNLV